MRKGYLPFFSFYDIMNTEYKEGYMHQIIIAIISGLCVAIPSVIATVSSNKRNNDLVIYRINELEKKVSKHNNVVERMALAEQKITMLQSEVEELKGAK